MNLSTQVPDAGTPIFNAQGFIDPVWHNFFNTMMQRTGGTLGIDAEADNALIVSSVDGASVTGSGSAQIEFVAAPVSSAEDQSPGFQAPSHGQQNDPILHDVATPTANGFMSATDKAKIDSVSLPVVLPSALIADVVTQNTTADGAILSFVMPPASIVAGTTIAARLYGLITSVALTGTVSVWIKSGASKVMTQTFTLPALGQTNTGLFYTASITVRTVGAGGTMQLSSLMTSNGNSLNGGPAVSSVSAAVDTTISNTFTIGWNWSVANAGNIATAKNSTFLLEKQQ